MHCDCIGCDAHDTAEAPRFNDRSGDTVLDTSRRRCSSFAHASLLDDPTDKARTGSGFRSGDGDAARRREGGEPDALSLRARITDALRARETAAGGGGDGDGEAERLAGDPGMHDGSTVDTTGAGVATDVTTGAIIEIGVDIGCRSVPDKAIVADGPEGGTPGCGTVRNSCNTAP